MIDREVGSQIAGAAARRRAIALGTHADDHAQRLIAIDAPDHVVVEIDDVRATVGREREVGREVQLTVEPVRVARVETAVAGAGPPACFARTCAVAWVAAIYGTRC